MSKFSLSRASVLTALVAAALMFAGKISAFGSSVAMSHFFGAGPESDAYFIASTIPGLAWGIILGTITVAFLPLYSRAKLAGDGSDEKLAHEAVQIYGLLAIVLGGTVALGARSFVNILAPDVSSAVEEMATILTVIMSFGFLFTGYVAIQNVVQQLNGQFIAPLAIPLINNIIAIVGIIVASYANDIRIAGFAAVGAWVLQAPLQRILTRKAYATSFRIALRSETIQRLALLSAPIALATLLDQANLFLGTYLAGDMGEGVISQLNYASRLALFVSSAVSTLISYFLFPKIANAAAADDGAELSRVIEFGFLAIIVTTIPLAAVSILMRGEVTQIIYGHGATTPADLSATAAIYASFSIGILFMAVREFMNRIFFSFQRNAAPLVIGIIASIANVVMSLWLSAAYGAIGIALGASFGALVYFAGQLIAIMLWRPQLLNNSLLRDMGGMAVATAPAYWIAGQAVIALGTSSIWLRLVVAGGVFSALFLGVLVLLTPKLRDMIRTMRRASV